MEVQTTAGQAAGPAEAQILDLQRSGLHAHAWSEVVDALGQARHAAVHGRVEVTPLGQVAVDPVPEAQDRLVHLLGGHACG